jgi:hypothetical protein
VNIGEYFPRQSRGQYSSIFTEAEDNNCFSVIRQVNIRETEENYRKATKSVHETPNSPVEFH